jgi:concentrative nucleoside transporter, CNT family
VSWLNAISFGGIGAFAAAAWLAGGCPRPVPWRTVAGSALLLLVLGSIVFWLPPTRAVMLRVNDAVLALLSAGNAGALFLLGPLAVGPGGHTAAGEPSVGFVLAAQVLPAVVFFAALSAALYHLRLIQPVVRLFARLFHRALGLSGAESLSGSANIFLGVESALVVRPYVERMTRSELLTVLTCGMGTVASTTLAVYVLFLKDTFPQIAGHLISASVLCIPASALVSKLMLPEREIPETLAKLPPADPHEKREDNLIAALGVGAWDGLRLAAGIATLLIAVLGVVAVLDLALVRSVGIDFNRILGWIFTPAAWLLGIESHDLSQAGTLLGQRVLLTEVVPYQRLAQLAAEGAVSPRTLLVLSYALCGFAHVASMGIFVGGTAALAPSRRGDIAALGPRALLCATLATLITGAIAGLFYHGQRGILGG